MDLLSIGVRIMDPMTSSFLSIEPLLLTDAGPDMVWGLFLMTPYRYARANPLTLRDPTGKDPIVETIAENTAALQAPNGDEVAAVDGSVIWIGDPSLGVYVPTGFTGSFTVAKMQMVEGEAVRLPWYDPVDTDVGDGHTCRDQQHLDEDHLKDGAKLLHTETGCDP